MQSGSDPRAQSEPGVGPASLVELDELLDEEDDEVDELDADVEDDPDDVEVEARTVVDTDVPSAPVVPRVVALVPVSPSTSPGVSSGASSSLQAAVVTASTTAAAISHTRIQRCMVRTLHAAHSARTDRQRGLPCDFLLS
jgi:hypothetical protein